MGKLFFSASFALVMVASQCFSAPQDEELARLRAEIAKLREENAKLKKQLVELTPPEYELRGVLKEKTVTLYIPPELRFSSTNPYRQETRLVIDLGKGNSRELSFNNSEESRKALEWKGKQVVVKGSLHTSTDNGIREAMLPLPSSGLAPPPLTFGASKTIWPTSVGQRVFFSVTSLNIAEREK